ncbi:D-alanyl-D-alanine carboxypeptidase family protein [Candidatus Saccharibacteria bacterium]|nr:D-alanyl-D-alanine carboxypeptidase family protein [Candidatus Saccharibacteria bacterium]
MAIGTLPDDEKTVDRTRESDELFNNVYGDGAAKGVNEAEQYANDPLNSEKSIQDQEEAPDKPSEGFKNNFTGAEKSKLKSINGVHFLKRKGPLGVIITLLLGGGFGFSALFSPGMLIVQMKEVMVDKFNTQLASMDVRTTKLISNKIDKATGGICTKGINIKCKYSSMSEKQVARFKAAGIDVEYDNKSITGRAKPTNFKFEGKNISPADFNENMRVNHSFRGAVRNAYNPKFAGYADSTWSKFAARIGLSKKPNITGVDDSERSDNLDKNTKNGDSNTSLKTVSDKDTNPATDPPRNFTIEEANAANIQARDFAAGATNGIRSAGSSALSEVPDAVEVASGSAGLAALGNIFKITGVADTGCQAYGAIQSLGYAAKTVRAIQLARYAMAFLNTADMIKDGTAKPGDVAYVGKILTDTPYDTKTNKKRGSATDSAGYKQAAYGDTGNMTSYSAQFLAGGGLTGKLINVTSIIKSLVPGVVKDTCKTLANPWVQGGSIIGGFALMLIPGVGQGASVARLVAQGAAQAVLGVAMAILPELLKDVIAGNVTSGISGEDSGDAYTSGSGSLMGGVANSGGNGAMTKADAVAYSSLHTATIASYTKDEVANLSPLDPSSRHTFLGSIVASLTPSISSTKGLVGNSLGTIGSILSTSLSGLTPNTSALSTEQYKASLEVCTDPDYVDMGIATDPFCNVIYGIPPKYLNKDPLVVIDELAGQIDDTTGEATADSDYAKFIDTCIGRKEPLGSGSEATTKDGTECVINDDNANYYLHHVDQRIDMGMDGYNTGSGSTDATTASGPSSVGTPENVQPKGGGWTLKDNTDYSAIPCAAGTTKDVVYTHPIRKTKIQTCAFAGDQVASIVSAKIVEMFNAAKATGVNLTLSSGFRSYEEQQALYSQNCGSGTCRPATAKPGNSQHEMGIAFDIEYRGSTICWQNSSANCHNNAGFDWLKSNASKYGFINLPKEAWHWSASGT